MHTSNYTQKFVMGDFHGDLTDFWKWQMKYDMENFVIICVGDTGFGFPNYKENVISKLNRQFEKRNITFYSCRGNHCDPSFFDGRFFQNPKYPRIQLVPDETILNIEGLDYYFFGGGISIDRTARKEGIDYWKDEKSNPFDPNIPEVDVVISHNCPRIAIPVPLPTKHGNGIVQMYARQDPTLVEELNKELDLFDGLDDCVKCQQWFFGHYHRSNSVYDVVGYTKYTCLGISEIKEVRL